MDILKSFCDIFKHKQTEDKTQNLTEAEQIHRLARLRALEIAMERRNRFSPFPRVGQLSIMEEADNAYDQAYTEVWNDFHR